MPLDCLPQHLLDVENHFPDDSQYLGIPVIGKLYYWWEKKTKGWFAIGNAANRSKYKWANWRKFPKTILAIRGNGKWRIENDLGSLYCIHGITNPKVVRLALGQEFYLSRVQYQLDCHIGLQWPLFFHSHYKDWQFYVGCKRDADGVYWLSLYLGKCWK